MALGLSNPCKEESAYELEILTAVRAGYFFATTEWLPREIATCSIETGKLENIRRDPGTAHPEIQTFTYGCRSL